MTWLQLLAQGAVFATFLGFFIAIVAYFNGKHIKESTEKTNLIMRDTQLMIKDSQLMIKDSQQMIIKETRQMIKEMQELTLQVLNKMDERAEERHRELLGKV